MGNDRYMFQDSSLERRHLPEGERIFSQGDQADNAFIVAAGKIGIYKQVEERKVLLGSLRAGSLFGEMAVLDGAPRMASAVTLAPSTLIVIPGDAVRQKMGKADPFIRALVGILIDNLRNVHTAYMVRPRSIMDHASVLAEQADGLRHFVINNKDLENFTQLAETLDSLDRVVAEFRRLATDVPDRRDSMIPPGEQLR